jgi:hypothetical protein
MTRQQDQNCSWWQVSRIGIQSAFNVVTVILTRCSSECLQFDTFAKHLLAMFVFWHYSAFPSWRTVRCLLRCWFPLCLLVGQAIVSFVPRPSLIDDQFSHSWRCEHLQTLIFFSLWIWSSWNCGLVEKLGVRLLFIPRRHTGSWLHLHPARFTAGRQPGTH